MPYVPITDTYLGYPLLLKMPDLDKGSSQETHALDLDTFASDAGSTAQITRPALPNTQRQISFLCETRWEWIALEDFLRTCAGRAYPFYLPTWNDDLTVIGAGFGAITIRAMGYTENLAPYAQYRRLFMSDRANPTNWWPRFVDSAVDNGDGTETLNGNVGFPYPLPWYTASGELTKFSFALLVRLDSDDIDVEFLTGEAVQVTLPIITVPEG